MGSRNSDQSQNQLNAMIQQQEAERARQIQSMYSEENDIIKSQGAQDFNENKPA